jgi:N-methylhydantoinase B
LDVQRGYVSITAAEEHYGVVIRHGLIDVAATAALRAIRTANPPHFDYGPERDAHEAIWTREAYHALTALLASLPVHWRFFVKGKMFAAMMTHPDIATAFAEIRVAYPEIPGAKT